MTTATPTPTPTPLAGPPRAPAPAPAMPPAGPPAHHRSSQVIGGLLVLGGLAWMAAELGWLDVGWRAVGAWLVVATGLIAAGIGLTGHRAGALLPIGWIVVVLLAVTATVPGVTVRGGVGDRLEQPRTVADLADGYELAAGTLTLDLTRLEIPPGTTTVTASVGAGEVRVTVPDDVSVRVEARAALGDVRVLGEEEGGIGPAVERTERVAGSERTLHVDLSVTTGEIEVTR